MRNCIRRGAMGTAQRGIVLVIALIVLVAMTLAGLALMRSGDTGTVIAGNLAFKQATTNAAESAVDAAYRQLIAAAAAGTGSLNNDAAFPGYRSSAPSQPEPAYTDPSWFQTNGTCTTTGCAADANGNVSYYVVHRMCSQANTPYNGTGATGVANTCATLASTGAAATGGSARVGAYAFQTTPQIYYRVTSLVTGPKNTAAVVQTMLVMSN